jgi:hypothetical protein
MVAVFIGYGAVWTWAAERDRMRKAKAEATREALLDGVDVEDFEVRFAAADDGLAAALTEYRALEGPK